MIAKIKIGKIKKALTIGCKGADHAPKSDVVYGEFCKLTVKAGKIGIHSASEKMSVSTHLDFDKGEGEQVIEEGECCMAIDKMVSMLSVLNNDDIVQIKYEPRIIKGTNKIGALRCKSEKNSWSVPCIDPLMISDVLVSKFAEMQLEIDKTVFEKHCKRVAFAVRKKDPDNILNNISVSQFEGKIYFSASDSVRYVVSSEDSDSDDGSILVPYDLCLSISKILEKGNIEIKTHKDLVFFKSDNTVIKIVGPPLISKEKFPRFQPILGINHQLKTAVASEKLVKNMTMAKTISNDEALMFINGDTIKILSRNDNDDTVYQGEVGCKFLDSSVEFGFNPMSFTDFSKLIEGASIKVEFSNDTNSQGWPNYVCFKDGEDMTYLCRTLSVVSYTA